MPTANITDEIDGIKSLATELAAERKEEELALVVFLKDTGSLTFEIPVNSQWTYEYTKKVYEEKKWGTKETQKKGVATARFVVIGLYCEKVVVRFGPTATFIENQIDYQALRIKMGGVMPILMAMRASLEKEIASMQKSKKPFNTALDDMLTLAHA